MNWTYFIILLAVAAVAVAVVPAVTSAPGHRLGTRRRPGVARYPDLLPVSLLETERPPTCVACGCTVTDEETHWRAIHHVPA